MGDGELSFAATILGLEVESKEEVPTVIEVLTRFCGGQSRSYDIEISRSLISENFVDVPEENISRFEIKKPSSGTIKLSKDGAAVTAVGMKEIRDISAQISRAAATLRDSLELYLSQETFESLTYFLDYDVSKINGGEIPRGRVLGSLVPESRTKFGLLQTIELLRHFRDAKVISREPLTINMGKKSYDTDIVKFSRGISMMLRVDDVKSALRDMEYNPLQIEALIELSHPVFDEPSQIVTCFENIAPPEKCFDAVDHLVLVSKDRFRVISKPDLKAELDLNGVTLGGRPVFKPKNFNADVA